MKIIVTGCKGQLGTEIIKQLREGRSEIGPIPEKLMNATVIPVDLPELDISNYKMVDDFIRRQRPDVIIKYVGGPLYVPPSSDPNYEPIDMQA